jgi:2-hydroxychromene-2-carboxylate isomerase
LPSRRPTDPPVKAALRTNTDAALGPGVLGVSSIVLGDEGSWSDDRLEEAGRSRGLRTHVGMTIERTANDR